ncbi:MAG: hypothetical protein DWQ10_08215 [Calditrichaeota bacterium]|nr:MAG: hypothetical protein DWQ10_08215 [Calditrichota bacterium]
MKMKFCCVFYLLLILFLMAGSCGDSGTQPPEKKELEIAWKKIGLDSLIVYTVATSPEGTVFVGSDGKIFRSADHGETWQMVASSSVRDFYFSEFSLGYATISQDGILQSTDDGRSWERIFIKELRDDINSVAFAPNGYVYLGSVHHDESAGGIIKSTDRGTTWERTTYPDTLGAEILIITDTNRILTSGDGGILLSDDDGQTWNESRQGFRIHSGEISYAFSSAVDPIFKDIYVALDLDGVYKSTDNGSTWTPFNQMEIDVSRIKMSKNGFIFIVREDVRRAYYSSVEGGEWLDLTPDIPDIIVAYGGLAIDAVGYIYLGTTQGIYRSEKPILK